MAKAEWGADRELFGPRHQHREGRILRELAGVGAPAGLHLECAAGIGSLAIALAERGITVVAADASVRSLAVVRSNATAVAAGSSVLLVAADVCRLPFREAVFAAATCAETLEHIVAHDRAAGELDRVLRPGSSLVGTVPADPAQWSIWDDWAGHLRRYTREGLGNLLAGAGLEAEVIQWGWPVLRLYDAIFLRRVNRRRLKLQGPARQDPALQLVAGLGRRRWLVRAVRAAFELDRLFDGWRGGVQLLFVARRPAGTPSPEPTSRRSASSPRSR